MSEQLSSQEKKYPVTVSVLLPCYNGEQFIEEAVGSILAQTFADFELIVSDDGSTDRTREIMHEFAKHDSRVVFLEGGRNAGICSALNRGLNIARGEFIARMDADDIADPRRLELQVALMRQRPNLVCCGSNLVLIDESGNRLGERVYPLEDRTIKKQLTIRSPFAHPTVMIRRSVMVDHQLEYSTQFPFAECYDLWMRLAPYGEFANLEEYLLNYRLWGSATKNKHCKASLWSTIRLKLHYFNGAGLMAYVTLAMESVLLLLPKSWILFLFKKKFGIK